MRWQVLKVPILLLWSEKMFLRHSFRKLPGKSQYRLALKSETVFCIHICRTIHTGPGPATAAADRFVERTPAL